MKKINIEEGSVIGLIPARGGSKSIPLKNIIKINNKPMISYVIEAAKGARLLTGIYCSTDHKDIKDVCDMHNIEVIERPESLGQDDTPVNDVIINVLHTLNERSGFMPAYVALLQPTSPFLLSNHIDQCVVALSENMIADSAQTITPVEHNSHAINQRIIGGEYVDFCFREERLKAYNKQKKPKHYIFGNLVVTRTKALLEGKGVFGNMSLHVEIDRKYAIDVDTYKDVDYASYLLESGRIRLAEI